MFGKCTFLRTCPFLFSCPLIGVILYDSFSGVGCNFFISDLHLHGVPFSILLTCSLCVSLHLKCFLLDRYVKYLGLFLRHVLACWRCFMICLQLPDLCETHPHVLETVPYTLAILSDSFENLLLSLRHFLTV